MKLKRTIIKDLNEIPNFTSETEEQAFWETLMKQFITERLYEEEKREGILE